MGWTTPGASRFSVGASVVGPVGGSKLILRCPAANWKISLKLPLFIREPLLSSSSLFLSPCLSRPFMPLPTPANSIRITRARISWPVPRTKSRRLSPFPSDFLGAGPISRPFSCSPIFAGEYRREFSDICYSSRGIFEFCDSSFQCFLTFFQYCNCNT